MCARAGPTRKGCLVLRSVASARDTGSVSRNSISEKKSTAQATATTVQRQAISASVSEGRRKAARKPSRVGERRDIGNQHNSILHHLMALRLYCFHLVRGRHGELLTLTGRTGAQAFFERRFIKEEEDHRRLVGEVLHTNPVSVGNEYACSSRASYSRPARLTCTAPW